MAQPALHRPVREWIAVLLPHAAQALGRYLKPVECRLRVVTSDEWLTSTRGCPAQSVVVDPGLLSPRQLVKAQGLLDYAEPRCVLYASVTPHALAGTITLARSSACAVLYQYAGHDLASVASVMARQPQPSFVRHVLQGIDPDLLELPSPIRSALRSAITDPLGEWTPALLASRAGVTRRTLDRWTNRTGLASARMFAALPKVLRAVTLIRETTLPLERVAEIAGYRTVRHMQLSGQALVGLRASEIRCAATLYDIADRIVACLTQSPLWVCDDGGEKLQPRGSENVRRGPLRVTTVMHRALLDALRPR